jgi:hypothetical protein
MDDAWKTFTNTSTGISIEYPNDWGYEEDSSLVCVLFATLCGVSVEDIAIFPRHEASANE